MPTRFSFNARLVTRASGGAAPTARTVFASGSVAALEARLAPLAPENIAPPAKSTPIAAATRPNEVNAARREARRSRSERA
jgi:hypothetical protein